MKTKRRKLIALTLVLSFIIAGCSSNKAKEGMDEVGIGEGLLFEADDIASRPPEGGPRVGPDGNPVTGVSGISDSQPQSPQAAAVEAEFLILVNRAREYAGVRPLGVEPGLQGYARAAAARIAGAGALVHSDIRDILGAWWVAGENIGYGPSATSIQIAYERSPGHYENLINPAFGAIGIGVFIDTAGRIWNAQDFAG